MTIVECILVIALYAVGFCFSLSFVGQDRFLRIAAAAFPLGCCLWAGCVFVIAAIPLIPKDIWGMNVPVSMGLCGLLLLVSLMASGLRKNLSVRCLVALFLGIGAVASLYWLFFQVNVSVITADSLSHIHPQKGFEAMKSGRAFNQTLAALAGIAGQDRYFFPFHQLFAVSLLVLMGECIFAEVRDAGATIIVSLAVALAGPLLLASTHMAAIQAFYVNNHLLVATLIVLAVSLLLGDRCGLSRTKEDRNLPLALLAVVVVSFLGLLRLEGQLVALILLMTMLGRPIVDQQVRIRSFLLFALLTSPVLLFMIGISYEGGKVDAANFFIMLLVTLILPLFFSIRNHQLIAYLQKHAGKYTVLSLIGCVGVFLFVGFEKMSYRLGWVVHNAFDESHWGFANHIILMALIFLAVRQLFSRGESGMVASRYNGLLLFCIASLLSIVFLTHFHGARLGWSSSQNRMLFHFFPIVILWVSIQCGVGLAISKEKSVEELKSIYSTHPHDS